jgi:hypothetical protein
MSAAHLYQYSDFNIMTQPISNKISILNRWVSAIHEKNGDIAITWLFRMNGFSWFSKDLMKEQMKLWRNYAKEGKLKIAAYNNKVITDDLGNKWYTLVVQPYDPETNKMTECPIDPAAMAIMGELVNGCMYMFKTESNRDTIVNYVMKNIAQPESEEDEDDEEDD